MLPFRLRPAGLSNSSVSNGRFSEEVTEIQRASMHLEFTLPVPWPLFLRPIPIELNPVVVRIPQVQRLAHSMICGSLQRYAGRAQPP
jgi:hypothetical protein